MAQWVDDTRVHYDAKNRRLGFRTCGVRNYILYKRAGLSFAECRIAASKLYKKARKNAVHCSFKIAVTSYEKINHPMYARRRVEAGEVLGGSCNFCLFFDHSTVPISGAWDVGGFFYCTCDHIGSYGHVVVPAVPSNDTGAHK